MKVISSIGGRFGNILFRTCTGKYLADQLECPFEAIFEGSDRNLYGEDNGQVYFDAIAPWFSNITMVSDAGRWKEVERLAQKEAGPSTFTKICTNREVITIDGHRHSPCYWNNDRKYAQQVFKSNQDQEIQGYVKNLYSDLDFSSLVSIHVRRGDYITNNIPSLPVSWFQHCIVSEFSLEQKFLIISDGISWCKENFQGDRFIFADRPVENFPYPKYLVDFYLCRLCSHNIVANSTFSWWGAYLNENPGRKVFYPWPWMSWATEDFIPINDNWVRISRN